MDVGLGGPLNSHVKMINQGHTPENVEGSRQTPILDPKESKFDATTILSVGLTRNLGFQVIRKPGD